MRKCQGYNRPPPRDVAPTRVPGGRPIMAGPSHIPSSLVAESGELLGVVFGVLLNRLLPPFITTVLMVLILSKNSYKTLKKAFATRAKENAAMAKEAAATAVTVHVATQSSSGDDAPAAPTSPSKLEASLELEGDKPVGDPNVQSTPATVDGDAVTLTIGGVEGGDTGADGDVAGGETERAEAGVEAGAAGAEAQKKKVTMDVKDDPAAASRKAPTRSLTKM